MPGALGEKPEPRPVAMKTEIKSTKRFIPVYNEPIVTSMEWLSSFKIQYEFNESVTQTLINGVSLLDSHEGLLNHFKNTSEIDGFVKAYGYDLEDLVESAELTGSIQEAVRFIKVHFLKPDNPDGLALEVPKKIQEALDVRELLKYSNGSDNELLRNWACAVLKVVHTISHMDRDLRHNYSSEIQKQIFDRFYRYLHRTESGQLYMGFSKVDLLRVHLVEFQTKPKKPRESTLMKLLHKPESVAEEVFDRIGLRLVTKTKLDSFRAIHFLEKAQVLIAANIKPSRSRNTLMDSQKLRKKIQEILECPPQIQNHEEYAALLKTLEETEPPVQKSGHNPFRSEHYRAIQFTCRQLIKIKNPILDQIREAKKVAQKWSSEEGAQSVLQAVDKIDLKFSSKVVRFFYPYEVQVMDEASYHENERGRSAHVEYKKAQQQAAMLRVMGALAHEPYC